MIVFIIYFICTYIIIITGLIFTNKIKTIPGPVGFIGKEGDIGQKGSKGEKGSRGNKGLKGGQGPPGKPGAIRGIMGPPGPDGPIGPKGLRGFRGFKGEKGDQGERGSKGFQGIDGLPGLQGDLGDPGEYIYNSIDYDKCTIHDFEFKSREMKCGDYEVLTEINNDDENYFGKCCKLKLNSECINKVAKTKWILEKDMTEKERKYKIRNPMTSSLYYEYDCEPGYKGTSQNEVFRCCLNNEDDLSFNKNY